MHTKKLLKLAYNLDKQGKFTEADRITNLLKISAIVDDPSGEYSDIFHPNEPEKSGVSESVTPAQPKVKTEVMTLIQEGLDKIKAFLASTYPDVKVVNHSLVGAAITFQYTDESDIDNTVYLSLSANDPRLKKINHWIWENVDNTLHYGKRPIQFRCMSNEARGAATERVDAIYNVDTNSFEKQLSSDVAKSLHTDLVASGSSQVRRDYKRIEANIISMLTGFSDVGNRILSETNPAKQKQLFEKWLLPKIKQIISLYKKVMQERSEAFSSGKSESRPSANWSDQNILYKFLEREQYLEILGELAYKDLSFEKFTEDMHLLIDKTNKILKQSSAGYQA